MDAEELPPLQVDAKNRTYENESFPLEGKYKGKERYAYPAQGISNSYFKIYTESKAKFMLYSEEKEYSMSWYAKGVGIVKGKKDTTNRGDYRRA